MQGKVRDWMDEAERINSDRPLIDFIAGIGREKLMLVQHEGTESIIGLVTIHDIARLPARL